MWIKTYDGQLLNSDLIEKIIVKQYENADSGDHYVLAVFNSDRVSGVIADNVTEKFGYEILDLIFYMISQGATVWNVQSFKGSGK